MKFNVDECIHTPTRFDQNRHLSGGGGVKVHKAILTF
jgi:hypothetical protein